MVGIFSFLLVISAMSCWKFVTNQLLFFFTFSRTTLPPKPMKASYIRKKIISASHDKYKFKIMCLLLAGNSPSPSCRHRSWQLFCSRSSPSAAPWPAICRPIRTWAGPRRSHCIPLSRRTRFCWQTHSDDQFWVCQPPGELLFESHQTLNILVSFVYAISQSVLWKQNNIKY